MEAIKITLETLYDILRNEKKREDLQTLENTFFIDVVSYLREKKALLNEKDKEDEIFAAGEKDKLEYELRSIKRILKEIYEKREKKIIDIALNKSRTGSDIIDTSAMLKEEKEFYGNVLKVLDSTRINILAKLFKAQLPGFMQERIEKKSEVKPNIEQEIEQEIEQGIEEDLEEIKETQEMMKIRFIHPTPSFIWKDMKEYGPFDIGEELEIYPEVAELLIRKKRAEKV